MSVYFLSPYTTESVEKNFHGSPRSENVAQEVNFYICSAAAFHGSKNIHSVN